MSYDIRFKAKLEGCDKWINVSECYANITWNVRKIITKSTGLPWKNEDDNGLCTDVIPKIQDGINELVKNADKYKPLESPNGWGTVSGTLDFFRQIVEDWNLFCCDEPEIAKVAHFWIE